MADPTIATFVADRFDPDGFNGRPWQEDRVGHSAFVGRVQKALDRTGRWATSGEFAMGGDVRVSIEQVVVGSGSIAEWQELAAETVAYEVAAECGVRISARCLTLDQALGMLHVFSEMAWALVDSNAMRGLVFHVE
jgi:hypothetical protein